MNLIEGMEAVPVHLTGSDIPVASSPGKRKRRAIKCNTFTLTAAQPVQQIFPQSDARVEGWITAAVGQPSSGTVIAEGSAADPAAGTTVAATGTLPAGAYTVIVYETLIGTVSFADAANLQLLVGSTVIGTLVYPGASENPTPPKGPYTVVVPAGGAAISVKTIGAGSGTATYVVEIGATPVAGTAGDQNIWIADSQAGANAQGGGSAQIAGTDTTPFPVSTTDAVWASTGAGFPVVVSTVAIYEEDQ